MPHRRVRPRSRVWASTAAPWPAGGATARIYGTTRWAASAGCPQATGVGAHGGAGGRGGRGAPSSGLLLERS